MSYKYDNCPLCTRNTRLDEHHIYPQRFFNGSGPTIHICHNCHQGGVEQIMPRKKLSKRDYRRIFKGFVKIKAKYHNIDVERIISNTLR